MSTNLLTDVLLEALREIAEIDVEEIAEKDVARYAYAFGKAQTIARIAVRKAEEEGA